MNTRDNMDQAAGRASQARDDLQRASEDLGRAADHAGDALRDAAKGMQAGASGTLERTRETVGKMANAESDAELRTKADGKTERALHKAGDMLSGAAPTVGRGVEGTLNATGAALHKIAGPLGTVVGAIAGKVGGWWSSASDSMTELPEAEEQACRVRFEAYEMRPAEMTYDDARTAFMIGHIAARNPTYDGRAFDEIEPDLRHGLHAEPTESYTSLRDFARYGYDRGTGAAGRTL